jgi:hypothetical protein
MGKVDDMRRLREQQHEDGQRAARARALGVKGGPVAAPATPAPPDADELAAAVEDAVVPRGAAARAAKAKADKVPMASTPREPSVPPPGRGKRGEAADETGVCSSCRKPKPLQRGVIANHQKGLGKMCPGSRKPPA